MAKGILFMLELLRICVLLFLSIFLLDGLERSILRTIGESQLFPLTRGIGNIALFIVLYRNVLQFKGWYKSERNRKLGPAYTWGLIVLAVGTIASPVWI